jgi:3-hydroxyisobutyrate dehydrogenase-like beta-hydroxyacid dehydrogenase
MEKNIGFVGLGNMGINMAKNLIGAGYHLKVHNRTISKANELDHASITLCKTPADAADGVQAIITMLSEDETLKETVLGEHGIIKKLSGNRHHNCLPNTTGMQAAFILRRQCSAGLKQQPRKNYGFVFRATNDQKKLQNRF